MRSFRITNIPRIRNTDVPGARPALICIETLIAGWLTQITHPSAAQFQKIGKIRATRAPHPRLQLD